MSNSVKFFIFWYLSDNFTMFIFKIIVVIMAKSFIMVIKLCFSSSKSNNNFILHSNYLCILLLWTQCPHIFPPYQRFHWECFVSLSRCYWFYNFLFFPSLLFLVLPLWVKSCKGLEWVNQMWENLLFLVRHA